ncbi:hypothetical protein AB0N07_46920 [Streptomyces sp. NPDC051172]|uniref:hypothetical protein n=1 Tax=Streptomyces sp. NPDC051172 TaxID=3155796 RepID=UPI00343B2AE2
MRACGTAVPLQALFGEDAAEAATVAGLGRALRGRASFGAAQDRLLCLQRNGELTAVVLVHPGGGEVLVYRRLARGLGLRQPVYAFQHPPVSTGPELHSDVLGLADTYRATLLERLPQGPYLGGLAGPDRDEALVAWRSLTDVVFHHVATGDHFSMMRELQVDGISAPL